MEPYLASFVEPVYQHSPLRSDTKFLSGLGLLDLALLQNLQNGLLVLCPDISRDTVAGIRAKLILDLALAGPVQHALGAMFVGDKDVIRVQDVDKRYRRVLAPFGDCFRRVGNHNKVV